MAKAGHIKVFRSIEDWVWFHTPGMLDFWIRLLLKAEWKGADRGSFVASVPELAKETKCTIKQARVFLARLVKTGEIMTERARIGAETRAGSGTLIRTRITICNYDSYQSIRRESGQDLGHDVGHDTWNEVAPPPYSPSSPSPTPSSSTPPISPSIFEEEEKEKEGDTAVSPKKESIDYFFIQKLWNDSMTRTKKIPKVASISAARKEKINLRIAEMGGWESAKGIIAECFRKINESDFCNGENDRVWVANIDWFFSNDKNWLKVYEGNYDNRQRKTRTEQLAELYQKGHEYYSSQRYGYGSASPYGDETGSGPYGPDEQ